MSNEVEIKLNKLETHRQLKRAKIFKIVVTVLLAIMIPLMIWGMVALNQETGGYKIRVGPGSEYRLSLSFDEDFKDGGHSVLNCNVNTSSKSEGATYEDLVKEINDLINGDTKLDINPGGDSATANGNDQYMVSKFYLKSTEPKGGKALQYVFRIYIDDVVSNALAAARIYIISDTDNPENSIHEMVAQPGANGDREYVATKGKGSSEYVKDASGNDWLCTNLRQNSDGVWYYESEVSFLQPTEACGLCVAAWYEGSDPNHNDSIIGGYFTYNLEFVIID